MGKYTAPTRDQLGAVEEAAENGEKATQIPKVKTSFANLTLNLVMCGLGAGLLSLPWGVAGAGIVFSLITIFFALALNAGTMMALVYCAERRQIFDLGSLVREATYSVWCERLCNWMIIGANWLCLVSYLLIIYDSLSPLLATVSMPDFFRDRRFIVSVVSALVYPLCFLPQQYLGGTSLLSVLCNIYLFVVVLVEFTERENDSEACILGHGLGNITMFSATMQTTVIQMCILPMYEEMDIRTPKRFGLSLAIAFGFLFLLFAAFSSFAYLTYGRNVQSNIFNSFPETTFPNVGRAGMLMVCLGVYPLMVLPMVASLGRRFRTGHFKIIAISIFVLSAMFTGWFVKELGTLNVINGAFCVGIFAGISPGITAYRLLDANIFGVIALIICALTCSVIGLIFSDNYAQDIICLWEMGQTNITS
eukprot:GEMP01029684.1.p1 GENE.GEMP01029684.1~~GEMP01029684.1.p1  ORF type:complete len:421 (+),score=55.16 GEMP01029684.1:31-1293(+)